MPLIKSGSREAISRNISEMIHAGHPRKQAVAAALSTARRYGKKSGGAVTGPAFRIPSDVIRKLGSGDPALGHAVLSDTLGIHPLAWTPGTIDADAVQQLGDGNAPAGHRVLTKLVQRIRAQRPTKTRAA